MSTDLPRLECERCGTDLLPLLPPEVAVEVVAVGCGIGEDPPHHVLYRATRNQGE